MSSYSFSHQFYQHWTAAPDTVRAAIVQELLDITTLLQADTNFETFTFNTHDLDAHLDTLYQSHEKQEIEVKEIAEKQAKLREAAEQQRLEDIRLEEERLEKLRLEDEKQALEAAEVQKEENAKSKAHNAVKNENNDAAVSHQDDNVDIVENDNNGDESSAESTDDNTFAAKPIKGAAINMSTLDSKLGIDHEDLIHELEIHVDDYLTEQMMQISEDLKSWLRAEVSRQLVEQQQDKATADNTDAEKKALCYKFEP